MNTVMVPGMNLKLGDQGAPYPTRTKCVHCEAYIGLQNPGNVCGSCTSMPQRRS